MRGRWSHGLVVAAVVFALVAAVLWTYAPALEHWPWGSDAIRWVGRADPSKEGWATWVFGRRHFIGWRPVTALSFTIQALWSTSPLALHAVDFGLVGISLGLVGLCGWEMARADRDDQQAWIVPVVAVIFVALHPVIQEIAPYVARRSYGLGSALGLLGLWTWMRALGRDGAALASPRILAATLLLTMSCASNEAMVPLVVALPLFGVHRLGREGWRPAVAPWGALCGLMVARAFVLSDTFATGYVKKYFVAIEGGRSVLQQLDGFQPGVVIQAAWSYALFPSSGIGQESLFWPSRWQASCGVGAVLGLWTLLALVVWPVQDRSDAVARRPLVLFAWALGTSMLYGLANTWFWREGYPLVLPLGLAVGAAVRAGWAARPGATGLAGLGLLVSVGWWSPVLWGWDVDAVQQQALGTAMIDDLIEGARDLPEGSLVFVVVPEQEDFAGELMWWAKEVGGRDDVRFRLLAWGGARVEERSVVLDGGQWSDRAQDALNMDGAKLAFDALGQRAPKRTFVWWWAGGELQRASTQAE